MILADGLGWGLAAVAVGVAWLCARAAVELLRHRSRPPAEHTPEDGSFDSTERLLDRS
jgi:hypothetical protein